MMKIMIASDIHGSAFYCREMVKRFELEEADRLLLLGDILYHGPRNDLPRDYDPQEVIRMLNPLKDKIYAVRGNCDTEVDQMVLEFPIMADFAVFPVGDRVMYATHGHQYNEGKLPPLQDGDILLNGHTHVPVFTIHPEYLYMNPGSVSIPKEDSRHSYMIMEGQKLQWKDLRTGELFLWKVLE